MFVPITLVRTYEQLWYLLYDVCDTTSTEPHHMDLEWSRPIISSYQLKWLDTLGSSLRHLCTCAKNTCRIFAAPAKVRFPMIFLRKNLCDPRGPKTNVITPLHPLPRPFCGKKTRDNDNHSRALQRKNILLHICFHISFGIK